MEVDLRGRAFGSLRHAGRSVLAIVVVSAVLLCSVDASAQHSHSARAASAKVPSKNPKAGNPKIGNPRAGAPKVGNLMAGAKHRELFAPPGLVRKTTPGSSDAKILRRRGAGIRFDALSGLSSRGGDIVHFNLFDDTAFDGVFTSKVKRSPSSYSWFGHILGEPHSTFSLAVENDVMIVNINVPGKGIWQVRYCPDGVHEIRRVDESMHLPCHGGVCAVKPDISAGAVETEITSQAGEPVMAQDSGSLVDVMVVYTPAVRSAEGGTTAMDALINLAIDEVNQAYFNSEIDLRIRLVHRSEVAYTESGSADIDLERLTDTDGYMDSVHSLRDTYGADMVCLFADYLGPGVGGIAWVMDDLESFEDYAFSVVRRDQVIGFDTFAHELGHNMGCHHAVGDGSTPIVRGEALYNYSHGWRFYGDSSTRFRTVMAYTPGNRIRYFSNPNILYDGQPTGRVDLEDNARTINNSASVVASWRESVFASAPPVAYDVNDITVKRGDWVAIELQGSDEGLPVPPGALSYVITSLPVNGTVADPQAGTIDSVPYVLVNYGDMVEYYSYGTFTGLEAFTYVADDSGISPDGGQSNTATVSIEIVDHLTEVFYASDVDLVDQMLTFVPDGLGAFYELCRDQADGFATDPAGGTVLSLSDSDSIEVNVTGGKMVGVYGSAFASFRVGSDGYISFEPSVPVGPLTLADHFSQKRISFLLADLDPSAGGTVSYKQLPDRVAVTFEGVPEYGTANSNDVQVEMFFQGTIRITYLNVAVTDAIAGLSNGGGLPAGFVESDLSGYRWCTSFDGDSLVYIEDLAFLAARWFDPNCADSMWCQGADLDRNNRVDAHDFGWFARHYMVDALYEQSFLSVAADDGRVWGDASGGTDSRADGTSDQALALGSFIGDDGYRFIVSFDTSSLPDDCIILSAQLEVVRGYKFGSDPFTWGGTCSIDIANPYFGAASSLLASDWDAAPDATQVATFAGPDPGMDSAMISTDFNADGLANINLAGTTQLRVGFSVIFNGSYNYLGFYSGDYADPAKHPKLTITYVQN
ncbi:MAG: hypothetical protein KAT00_10160 [Planctomycetes bacterium]|nr:hypothetical protein [Planctomycetota bacterium]